MTLIDRRAALAAAGAVASTALFKLDRARAEAPAGPFHLPPLPYATTALSPTIDAKTMEIHHDKHHGAYVANMNAVAKEVPQLGQRPIEDVLANLASVPEAVRTTVRNNLGGHANHTMYWQIMGAPGSKPDGEVLAAITRDFGGLEPLQTAFNTAGGKVFGSGWVFVTVAKDGKLALEARPNQDTPLMDGKRVLFGNDVWEHAYYLTYQNRRPDFLKAWWSVVDWAKVGDRFARAKQGTLTI